MVGVAIGLVALIPVPKGLAEEEPTQPEPTTEEKLRAEAKVILKEKVQPFVRKYCTDCHGSRPEAGINLESALKDPGTTSASLHWRKAVANVRVHDMPPEDAGEAPTDEERLEFVDGVGKLKYLAPMDPGQYVMRRLNRTEYGNTVHDLFGVDPSIGSRLPDEVEGEGFLNSISPLQSEIFLELANEVVKQVVSATGMPPTEIQKKLFRETPADPNEYQDTARQVARRLTREAYRRPASDSELDVLMDIFDLARDHQMDYQSALGMVLKAVLVSPQFLFITPVEHTVTEESIVALDDYQLASRLSYLLWSSPPDPELASLADQGRLHEPGVLGSQIERLLEAPRSRALFDGFGAHWLGLRGFADQTFDLEVFPELTPELREAMLDEVRLLFQSVIDENGAIFQLIDTDYTYLNGPLANLYGLEDRVQGRDMQRIQLEDRNRGGILGMPATLATTSLPNRTSPVRRGYWVLERVLGETVPPPPPNVPELKETEQKNVEGLTLRQRTELHQSQPTCANCHRLLDPIGFGLESFDAIGRWREVDDVGGKIDSAGQLSTGETFSNPAELKTILALRKEAIARNLTERFMAYAIGRPLEGYDEVVIDQLMATLTEDGYRMRTMIREVLSSYLFTHRKIKG
ncbi:MAG: DUF1592 domain-containing protein [Planctomycetota bacterium]|nr:DUF1592 domain-containing protein [Planctomycetota bacterium]